MRLFHILRRVEVNRGPNLRWQAFRLWLIIVSYRILGLKVIFFKWCNRREGLHTISECLDHFMDNWEWQLLNSRWVVSHKSIDYSDHLPITLIISLKQKKRRRKKLFRFKALSTDSTECYQNIFETWNKYSNGGSFNGVMQHIENCNKELEGWNQVAFGSVQRKLHLAHEKQDTLQSRDPLGICGDEHKATCKDVHLWLEREEKLWRQ